MRNETFGRLLKAGIGSIATCEGKTAPAIEEEVGEKIGVSAASIQRYKAGHLPPERRTIELLAEACIRRGLLSREWLQKFLHVASYHAPESLIDRLCPNGSQRPRPARVYQNLPAPTYSQFVMRQQAFAEVVDGLQQRSAVVLIAGLGGNGKTSLARELAARCLKGEDGTPQFDAVVWVSDKDEPGTTNLSVVLDEIARTLDYPGYTQFDHDEKRREVEHLLRRQKVLLAVDNFETITDGALLSWLLRLPEPSKAIVTTREYSRAFRNNTYVIDLRGMTESEAQEFIANRLRFLRIEKLVNNLSDLAPLIVATGGNPKAIEIALGCIKYERLPLQQVVEDLYAARSELFDDLFTRAWALLDEAARRMLLSATLFPDSTNAEALAATADVQGFAFDRVVERLTDLALLDVQQLDLNSTPRYILHQLVRAYAEARLETQPDLEAQVREHWVNYFHDFAIRSDADGWDYPYQFDRVEPEITNLQAVMHHCYSVHRWEPLIRMVLAVKAFWNTRGYFKDRDRFVSLALSAAERDHNIDAQIRLLCIKTRALCYRNDVQAAIACCRQAQTLLQSFSDPEPSLVLGLQYAQIQICRIQGDFNQMLALAESNVSIAGTRHWQRRVIYQYDIAEYLYRSGKYATAEQLLQQLIESSIQFGYRRIPIRGWLLLVKIAVCTERLGIATQYLQKAQEQAQELKHDRYLADVSHVAASLHVLRGDIPAARAALAEAIDLFERLGMRRELTEAREELARIETAIPVSAEPASA